MASSNSDSNKTVLKLFEPKPLSIRYISQSSQLTLFFAFSLKYVFGHFNYIDLKIRYAIGMTDDICDFCKGLGSISSHDCVYCNGTGEWNQAAQAYVKNHICQCIVLDRKFCPVCNKACHHDTSLNPKQKIDPGYGGSSIPEITVIS